MIFLIMKMEATEENLHAAVKMITSNLNDPFYTWKDKSTPGLKCFAFTEMQAKELFETCVKTWGPKFKMVKAELTAASFTDLPQS